MTTINNLSTVGQLTDEDFVPVFSVANQDARKVTMENFRDYIYIETAPDADRIRYGDTNVGDYLDDLNADGVEYDGGTVQDVLDGAKSMQGYTQLDGYQGRATVVRLAAQGIAGHFVRDDADTATASSGICRIDGLGRRWKRIIKADYLDSWWQPAKNGTSDDAPVYQAIAAALPEGATLRCVGAGTRALGSETVFNQDFLNIACEPGVKFIRRAGSGSVDRLIFVSGDYGELRGFDVDSNCDSVSITGRGEFLKVGGNRVTVQGLTIRNTHIAPNACGLYITGNDVTVYNVTCQATGRVAIRDKGDNTLIEGVRAYSIRMNADGIGNKVIAKDGGAGDSSGPFKLATYKNIYGQASETGFYQTIVVDDSLNVGGRVIVDNIYCDYPLSTGVDVIKFVNVRRVDIFGLTTVHAGDNITNASLRFQEGVSEVYMQGLDLAGMVNFDTTNYVRAAISGECYIGRSLKADACIDDFPNGVLTISTGAILAGFYKYPIRTNPGFFDAKILLESLIYRGSDTYLASPWDSASARCIVRHSAYLVSGVKQRIDVGQIQIAAPAEIIRTRLPSDGRWVTETDGMDSAVSQDGRLLAASGAMTTNGPESNGWKLGMEFVRRDPVVGQSVYKYVCTTSGASSLNSWATNTSYSVGNWRGANGNVYACATGGTSALSGTGPSGTGTGITDGSCTWDYVDTRSVFKPVASIGA